MRRTRQGILGALAVLLMVTTPGLVAAAAPTNGIHVAEPKLFDARALFLMLEELEGQLERISVVDQQKLIGALGQLQGQRVSELEVAGSVTSTPTPGTTTKLTPDEDTGELVPVEVTETRTEFTPQVPTLPTQTATPTSSLSFGVHAQDLLSDQVNLTYQIFSLRLLLERALSDRLLKSGDPRQQAILGFRVNIDPPRKARRRAAFVEVAIVPKNTSCKCDLSELSVVALMPQEKTYNASSVSTKSGAFGGAAVAGVFSLGVNVKKKNQVFYLYRDSDTISFPHLAPPAELGAAAIAFGWQFRPVLGRKSVSAEPRQLMAVLALPQGDTGAGAGGLELEVHVRTYWRKYHAESQTSRRQEQLGRGPVLLGQVAAWKSGWTEESLRPSVESVSWSTIGADKALVTVNGQNLFPGTRVLLGDTTIDETSGLILKSDRTLEFTTSMKALATQDGRLSGRFGPSVDLKGTTVGEGVFMNSTILGPVRGRQLVNLEVILQHRRGEDLPFDPNLQPLIAVGGVPLPGPYDVTPIRCRAIDLWNPSLAPTERDCISIQALVPASAVKKDVIVSARIPLFGKSWYASRVLEYTSEEMHVERIGGKERVTLAIHGWAFSPDWRILLDQEYAPAKGTGGAARDVRLQFVNPELLLLQVKAELLAKYARLGVKSPSGQVVEMLAVPGFKVATPKAVLKPGGQMVSAVKDSAVVAKFKGENLSKVSKVLFGADELRFTKTSKEITIFLTRKVTAKAGEVHLLLEAEGGTHLVAKVRVTG